MSPAPRRAAMSPALAAFGRQLRRYRERSGLSQARLAHRTGRTASSISQIENGKKRCKRDFVEMVDLELKANGALLQLYDDLNQDGALGFPTWFDWPNVETEAALLTWWEHTVVPGLLQIESYARMYLPTEQAVAARMARQSILTRDDPEPPKLIVLLGEQVLYHLVGTPALMKEQVEHLVAMSELPNITIQIVMNDDGRPAGNGGAFIVATMADRSEVAYLDTMVRGITTDDVHDLSALADALTALRSKALPVNMSRDLMRRAIKEKWTT